MVTTVSLFPVNASLERNSQGVIKCKTGQSKGMQHGNNDQRLAAHAGATHNNTKDWALVQDTALVHENQIVGRKTIPDINERTVLG